MVFLQNKTKIFECNGNHRYKSYWLMKMGQYDTDLYLKSLKEYHSTNDNVHFIVDMLHQYLSTKQIKRENQNDKTK